jgi:hypothetical protein
MRHKPGCGRYYFAHGAVERLAYFSYILSAESIHQRSFLPATHGTRFALHRSVERIQNFFMFVFCHGIEFYQAVHVAEFRVPRQCVSIIMFRFRSRSSSG